MMMRRKITATRRTPAVVPVAAEVAPAPVEALTRGRVMGQPNGCGVFIATHGEKWNLPPEQMRGILHGDRVAVRLVRTDYRGRKEGAVVEVLESREVVGRLYRERNTAFIAPHETRYGRDIAVAGDGEHDALPDDIVVAKIVRHPFEHRYALGEVVEVLGNRRDVEGAALKTKIAVRQHSIPNQWNDAVTAELTAMGEQLLGASTRDDDGRADLRELPFVTIDGEDARDFDDAVLCRRDADGWRLWVAIADVGHYVRADTALDKEALLRGNSAYFPGAVVPMLPETLSNGICSLRPEQDRYCMVCEIQCTAPGAIKSYQFYPAVMRSQARLTYSLANQLMEQSDSPLLNKWRAFAPQMDDLHAFTQLRLALSSKRGAIDFEFPEAEITLDENQQVNTLRTRTRNHAHRAIEQCMLAANACAARFLRERLGRRAIYRNHRAPQTESLSELRRVLAGFSLELGGGVKPQPSDYAQLLSQVAQDPAMLSLVQTAMLQSLTQAEYSNEQIGHFALALPIYTHFTSPIRRYPDLIVHRLIRGLLQSDAHKTSESPNATTADSPKESILDTLFKTPAAESGNAYDAPNAAVNDSHNADQVNNVNTADTASNAAPSSLDRIAAHCSFTERRAEDASREVIAALKAEYMQSKVGDEFDGVVSSVKAFGLFVQLTEVPVDGLVHVSLLGDDYYQYDAERQQLVGARKRNAFGMGLRVRVRLMRVHTDDGKIDFALCK